MTSSPRLEKVTPDNVLAACRLKVQPYQERLVAPVARSLAEAYVHPELAWPRLIFDGEQLVGFERTVVKYTERIQLDSACRRAITAGTGIDALAHCLEAYCGPFYHPLADGIAVEGIRLVKDIPAPGLHGTAATSKRGPT